jgi:hypothetical protein
MADGYGSGKALLVAKLDARREHLLGALEGFNGEPDLQILT